jgi:methyl-accepting chemotaxis protein
MTRAITETAGSSQEVSTAVETTAQGAVRTSEAALEGLDASRDLAGHAAALKGLIAAFRY